ncbi:hypothetical protein FM120_15275 [Sphingobacterium faecium PCAi_F2.5]|nr:hypothetical protein FM120_15275 [Sphingobacterium faecium PCAi_F2.5]
MELVHISSCCRSRNLDQALLLARQLRRIVLCMYHSYRDREHKNEQRPEWFVLVHDVRFYD